MTSKYIPTTPRPRSHKAVDVDRISPSTKFGDGSLSPKAGAERRLLRPLSCEKRSPISRGAELQQLQAELAKTKGLLIMAEKCKSNILQDLSRSKRQVEDLLIKIQEFAEASKRDRLIAEEMELFTFTETENWQVELDVMKQRYEVAVLELQTDRQTIKSLRQELRLCEVAKDESVKLAGEAMNAAELTAKQVEELSAELLSARGYLTEGDNLSFKMNDLMDELLAAQKSLAEAITARDRVAMEGEDLLAAKDAELKNLAETASAAEVQLENLRENITCKENWIYNLISEIDVLRAELNSTKDARNSAILAVQVIHRDFGRLKVNFDRINTEMEETNKMKSSETIALVAANENFIEATMKEVVLESYLLFLTGELERNLAHVLDLEMSQASAAALGKSLTHELDSLKQQSLKELNILRLENAALKESEMCATASAEDAHHQLNKIIETNQKTAMLLAEKEMSVSIAMESFKQEIEKLNWVIAELKEREMQSTVEARLLTERLKCNDIELVDLREKYEVAAARSSALERELESSHRELATLRQRESNMTSDITALLSELELRHLELAELKGKVASLDSQAAMLDSKLQREARFVVELNRRCISLVNHVTALSIVVARLAHTKDCELVALATKEATISTEVILLNGELAETKKDLQIAASTWMLAVENSEKLNASLKKAMAENESLEQEAHAARIEALESKEDALRAAFDLEAAQNKTLAAQQEAQSFSLELNSARQNIETLQMDAQIARQEIEAVRMQFEGALLDAQKTSKELELARSEIEGLRSKLELCQNKLQAQKTQLKGEVQMAKDEAATLQAELLRACVDKEDYKMLWINAENRLKCATQDLQIKDYVRMDDGTLNEYYVDAGGLGLASQDELNHLKERLRYTEQHLAAVLLEIDATKASKEQLCKELDDIKMENEVNKSVILDVQDHLADTEKAKSNMEDEIQRLLDDGKLWAAAKDAIEIPINKDTKMRSLSSENKEWKPQLESIRQLMKLNSFGRREEGDVAMVEREEVLLKEEVMILKQEVSSFPAKKRKKPLFLRLGTYLDKKKT